jgi:hypothetical protein
MISSKKFLEIEIRSTKNKIKKIALSLALETLKCLYVKYTNVSYHWLCGGHTTLALFEEQILAGQPKIQKKKKKKTLKNGRYI